MKDKIHFYVGIILEDVGRLKEFISNMNEDSDQKFSVDFINEYDDLHGYYTYHLKGYIEAYRCFLNAPFIKSLSHDEE